MQEKKRVKIIPITTVTYIVYGDPRKAIAPRRRSSFQRPRYVGRPGNLQKLTKLETCLARLSGLREEASWFRGMFYHTGVVCITVPINNYQVTKPGRLGVIERIIHEANWGVLF